jgi:hypothetical protein
MKIGDKVRFTNDGSCSAPTGSTAKVVGTKAPYIQVEWIDKGDSGQMDGSYYPEHFEVIEEGLPEKWYMQLNDLSDEELKQCDKWRKSVCTDYKKVSLEWDHILVNYHDDGSYYFAGPVETLPHWGWAEGIKEITFEQFKKHILKQETKTVMSKQKLTVPVTDVLEIHGIACDTWKSKIATDYLPTVDKNQNITFKQYEVDKMFKAATISQLPVLEKIFGLQHKELTLKDMANGQPLFREDAMGYGKAGMIEVRAEDEYKDKAFWLSHLYNWEIKTDSCSMLVLIPTPKN